VDLVLDGGFCSGLGSTTVDLCGPDWKLIREGAIPSQAVEEVLGHHRDPDPL
jgi:tRNA A37 threonylcarbamoyladenosine synthetase subunit TsaC/SUA5/YrdC